MLATTQDTSIEHVLQALEDKIEQYPTVQDAAEALGVTRGFLWKVRSKKQAPPNSLLKQLGYSCERKITYVYRKVN
jgi:hypothetical protein